MKKYRLELCESAGIELTEEKFNKFRDCEFNIDGTKIVKGKEIVAEGKPYPIVICCPIENFEVLDDGV